MMWQLTTKLYDIEAKYNKKVMFHKYSIGLLFSLSVNVKRDHLNSENMKIKEVSSGMQNIDDPDKYIKMIFSFNFAGISPLHRFSNELGVNKLQNIKQ